MTARALVVELLTSALPSDVDVIAYAHNIDAPSRSTVMVRTDRVIPSPAGQGLRQYEFGLVLIASKTTAGPADDELDELLEDVLYALTTGGATNGVNWTQAVRATYGEPDGTNPAYELTLQATIATEPEQE